MHLLSARSSSSALLDSSLKVALSFGFALLLTLLEAYGYREEEFLPRFGFWVSMMITWVILSGVAVACLTRTPARRLGPVVIIAAGFCAALVPMTLISLLASHGMTGWAEPGLGIERMLQASVVVGTFELVHHVTVTSLRRSLSRLSAAEPAASHPPEPATAPASRPPLVSRLPAGLQGPVICLEMEDHYVRVHTPQGSALLLMRFSDALAELDPSSGLRVHRSWWIAAEALTGVERRSRSVRAHLSNGLVAPVSRPYVRTLMQLAEKRNIVDLPRP